jgi:hypothetical protein
LLGELILRPDVGLKSIITPRNWIQVQKKETAK